MIASMIENDLKGHAARIEALYEERDSSWIRLKHRHLPFKCFEQGAGIQLVRHLAPRDHLRRIGGVVIGGLLLTLLGSLAIAWAIESLSEDVWVTTHPIARPLNFALYGMLGTLVTAALTAGLLFTLEPCSPSPTVLLTWDPVSRIATIGPSQAATAATVVDSLLCAAVYIRDGGRAHLLYRVESLANGKPVLLGETDLHPGRALEHWRRATGIPYSAWKTKAINLPSRSTP
ncbi:MAG: hypothetical protein ACKVZJ_15340 [Phycisphaerales bacterium]